MHAQTCQPTLYKPLHFQLDKRRLNSHQIHIVTSGYSRKWSEYGWSHGFAWARPEWIKLTYTQSCRTPGESWTRPNAFYITQYTQLTESTNLRLHTNTTKYRKPEVSPKLSRGENTGHTRDYTPASSAGTVWLCGPMGKRPLPFPPTPKVGPAHPPKKE